MLLLLSVSITTIIMFQLLYNNGVMSDSTVLVSLSSFPSQLVLASPIGCVRYKGANAGRQSRANGRCVASVRRLSPSPPPDLEQAPHKYFDQVAITVRSGDGGHGAVLKMPRPKDASSSDKHSVAAGRKKEKAKRKASFKRDSDGTLILPAGGHGGDVVLYAEEKEDTLLQFHNKKKFNAKRGSNVDAMGILSPLIRHGASAPTLRIPVPVGTVVKKKRGTKLFADLMHPGDEVLVARGGRGGISIIEIPKSNKTHLQPVKGPIMTDPDDKALIIGAPGEEIALELTLRVVADVGLVGLPNAGKSSLLAAITRAKPEIAEYPFTTLMPNLGRLEGDPERKDGGISLGPTMADLPGLIKGAHLGKGLGRMFLRHLRRTRLIVHVVDASAADPLQDYMTLREELLMYNPEYLCRPHIVALNKLDIREVAERFDLIQQQFEVAFVKSFSCALVDASSDDDLQTGGHNRSQQLMPQQEVIEGTEVDPKKEKRLADFPPAVAVIGISALCGTGVDNLLKEVRLALRDHPGSHEDHQIKREPRTEMYKSAKWHL